MSLDQHGEAVRTLRVDDRHKDGVVGGVGIAVIGRIVQKGVPAMQLWMELLHRPGEEIGAAQDMDGITFGSRHQFVRRSDDAAGEIPRGVEHAGASRAQQGIGHLAHDVLETLVENRKPHTVEPAGACAVKRSDVVHARASLMAAVAASSRIARLPSGGANATAPGATTVVVKFASTSSGPAI